VCALNDECRARDCYDSLVLESSLVVRRDRDRRARPLLQIINRLTALANDKPDTLCRHVHTFCVELGTIVVAILFIDVSPVATIFRLTVVADLVVVALVLVLGALVLRNISAKTSRRACGKADDKFSCVADGILHSGDNKSFLATVDVLVDNRDIGA
jgi:hypothetical protein